MRERARGQGEGRKAGLDISSSEGYRSFEQPKSLQIRVTGRNLHNKECVQS